MGHTQRWHTTYLRIHNMMQPLDHITEGKLLFDMAMQTPSHLSQSTDALAFISQTHVLPTDESLLRQPPNTDSGELSTQSPPIQDGCGRCEACGCSYIQSCPHSIASCGGNKEQRPSLRVHFQVAPFHQHQTSLTNANCTVHSSSSSSIGQGSDNSSCSSHKHFKVAAGEEMEVQSSLRSPLDQMSGLEESLPFKKGLSTLYKGKSRSFACLTDVSSLHDLAKPENPYAKKRKWLHGHGNDSRNRVAYPPVCQSFSEISKESFSSSRDSNNLTVLSTASAPGRSFSLSDLQGRGR